MRGVLGWPKYAPDGTRPPSTRRKKPSEYTYRARLRLAQIQKRIKYKTDAEWYEAKKPKLLARKQFDAAVQKWREETKYAPWRIKGDAFESFKRPFIHFKETGMLFYDSAMAADMLNITEQEFLFLRDKGIIPEPDERGFSPAQLYFLAEAAKLSRRLPGVFASAPPDVLFDLQFMQDFLAEVWEEKIAVYELEGGKERWHEQSKLRVVKARRGHSQCAEQD